MMYADDTFYRTVYCGQMDKAEFARFSVQASAYLDAVTFGRIPPDWEEESYAERIRLACCAAADAYRCNEQGGGIASETNDGISVTYVSGIRKAKTDEERLFDAVRLYLGSTGLLCRWV